MIVLPQNDSARYCRKSRATRTDFAFSSCTIRMARGARRLPIRSANCPPMTHPSNRFLPDIAAHLGARARRDSGGCRDMAPAVSSVSFDILGFDVSEDV